MGHSTRPSRWVFWWPGLAAVAGLAWWALAWPGSAWHDALSSEPPTARLDPAAWGSDHVGHDLPEHTEGSECLFCHRQTIAHRWARDAHNQTMRPWNGDNGGLPLELARAVKATVESPDGPGRADWILGGNWAARLLRKSPEYGRAELLSGPWVRVGERRWKTELPGEFQWHPEQFAERCAGCHATAVQWPSRAFGGPSLDCFVCHGDGPPEHANDPGLMRLSRRRHDPPREVASLCGQCHLRGGKSASTGLPYPHHFVAGDNLFRDFEFDWRLADAPEVDPSDRHVFDAVRRVVIHGQDEWSCLVCHEVHAGSSRKHRDLPDDTFCAHCHDPARPKSEHVRFERHSAACEY